MDDQSLTMTVSEAAAALKIGRGLAYDAVRRGEIPAIRVGKRLLIPRRALERLLEQGQLVTSDQSKS
jgi:excisionase family DNA binding protein